MLLNKTTADGFVNHSITRLLDCMDTMMLDETALTGIENTITQMYLQDTSGTGMYTLWLIHENRRFGRIFKGDFSSDTLEERIANIIENHNMYYKTNYKRSDIIILRETNDDTILLTKAIWRQGHLLKTIERMENEISILKQELLKANQNIYGSHKLVQSLIAETVDNSNELQLTNNNYKQFAQNIIAQINELLMGRHVINPCDPVVQINHDEQLKILENLEHFKCIESKVPNVYGK